VWGARRIKTPHPFLGERSRWIERSGTYEITQFTLGTRDFLVYRHRVRIAVKHSLSGAKRAAEKDARDLRATALKRLSLA